MGNTNLPPSRRQGFELDGKARAGSSVTVSAAYAYTEAKFLEGMWGGNTVPLVPRHKLNLGVAWDLASRTRLSAAASGVSEQRMDNDEPNSARRIPAYYLVDLKLAQSFAWGRIAATVNNLFDEKYYDYAVRSAFTPDRYSVYPLPGRSFGFAAEVALH